MQIDEGIDLLRTMFSAGYGLAICGEDWDGEILTTFNKRGEQIIRELNRARRESDRKKQRADSAARQRREHIRNGELSQAFKPGDGRSPFWVDFFPKARGGKGEFKLNDHKWLIQRIFELGRTMGAGKIAIQLRNEGVVHPRPRNKKKKPKPLSPGTVRYWCSAIHSQRASRKPSESTSVFPPVVMERSGRRSDRPPQGRLATLGRSSTVFRTGLLRAVQRFLPYATAGVRPQTPSLTAKTRYLMVRCHHVRRITRLATAAVCSSLQLRRSRQDA